jgi:membrane protease YdiL (CAAX protease family)
VNPEHSTEAEALEPSGVGPVPVTQARPHRWGIGAFLLVEVVYLLTSAALTVAIVGHGRLTAGIIAMGIAVPTTLAAGVAILITKLRGNGPRTDLRLRWSWRGLGQGLLFGFGGLLVTIPASMVYRLIVGSDANSAVGRVFQGLRVSWPWAVAVFLLVVLVAPVCEEIIFRGLLWGALDWRWGRWAALAVTTVVFALAHFELTRAPLLIVIAIPIGLARLYSGGLMASVVAHQVTNLLPGLSLMLALAGVTPAT